ncbi:MAG: phytoene/squalene synthase family protein [Candidatus Methylopumilus sp.]|nr:phytoene/squalene synthase family protein [Candidatus Methylopumilus sp.]
MMTDAYQTESNLILARSGKTFFWARFCLNQIQAREATRLYRFCRYIDDIGDDSVDAKQAKKDLRHIIESLRSGTSQNPIVRDAINLFKQYQIEVDIPILLIDGVISDLDEVAIKDIESLLIYCYQVAGTVGIMMCKILGVKNQAAYAHAIDLGVAMQLTNICRDVKEDALLGRHYLPKTLLGNLSLNTLMQPDMQSQMMITNGLKTLLALADQYYASAAKGFCFLPLRARFAIALAAKLYQQIGVVLRNNDYQYWQQRAYVSTPNKVLLSLGCIASHLINPLFYRYQYHHSAILHQSLRLLPYANTREI